MQPLNKKEQLVYDYIKKNIREHGYSPSVRDIREALGYKSTSTVHMYIERLLALGYIKKEDGKSRTLRLGEDAENDLRIMSVPVCKRVSDNGEFEEIGEKVQFCTSNNRDPEMLFAFRVRDGITGAGIMPGDLIIAEKCDYCPEKCPTVISVFGEFSLRYMSETGSGVTSARVNQEYTIVGRVIALVRKF